MQHITVEHRIGLCIEKRKKHRGYVVLYSVEVFVRQIFFLLHSAVISTHQRTLLLLKFVHLVCACQSQLELYSPIYTTTLRTGLV